MNKQVVIIRNAYAHDFGGGERFPVFLAKSLDNFGYEPTIISRNWSCLRLPQIATYPPYAAGGGKRRIGAGGA